MTISHEFTKKAHAILICAIIGFEIIKTGTICLLRMVVKLPFSLDTIIIYGFLGVIILFSLLYLRTRIKIDGIILLLLLLVLLCISWLTHSGYDDYYLKILLDILLGCACYIVVRASEDYELIIKYLRITALIIMVASLIYATCGMRFTTKQYSQSLGYNVMPAYIISFDAILDGKLKKYKVLHIISIIVSVFLIILSGARGPLFCVVIFTLIRIFFGFSGSLKKQIIIVGIFAIIATLLIVFFDQIFVFLYTLSEKLGLSTRMFRLFIKGSVVESQGRDALFPIISDLLQGDLKTFFLGTGIGADRILIANSLQIYTEPYNHYPHNLFYEFILQYGIIVGVVVSAVLIVVMVYLVIKSRGLNRQLFLIFAGIGFIPLMFSYSYLSNEKFFVFIAFVVSVFLDVRERTNKNHIIVGEK